MFNHYAAFLTLTLQSFHDLTEESTIRERLRTDLLSLNLTLMKGLFSNRYRLHKLAIAILLTLGLCTYSHIIGNRYAHQKSVILKRCLQNPISCVDKPLTMRVRINQSPDSNFIAHPLIWDGEYSVPLSGDLSGIQHGYVIDILGAYALDSTFNVSKFQRNNWIRPVKYAISLLGLVFTIILMSRRYRLSSGRLFLLIHR